MVVLLTLLAAALSALSAAGEQRAASRVARAPSWRSRRRRLAAGGFALALVSSPLWLASWAVDALSFFAQAAALRLGSISVVQPLMVTTLLFSLPLAAWIRRGRVAARDWVAAAVLCAGLAMVLATRAAPTTDSTGSAARGELLPALGAASAVAMMIVLAARGRRPVLRAAMLSVAAGVLFSVGAATTKLTAATATDGGFVALLTSWPGYALAVVSVISFALQQAAYAIGALATAVTAVVITDPLVSYVLGVVGFGEPVPRGAALTLAVPGVILLVAGVGVLARSPLLHPPAPATPAPTAPVAAPLPASTVTVDVANPASTLVVDADGSWAPQSVAPPPVDRPSVVLCPGHGA